jgi:hypothetical protein
MGEQQGDQNRQSDSASQRVRRDNQISRYCRPRDSRYVGYVVENGDQARVPELAKYAVPAATLADMFFFSWHQCVFVSDDFLSAVSIIDLRPANSDPGGRVLAAKQVDGNDFCCTAQTKTPDPNKIMLPEGPQDVSQSLAERVVNMSTG